MSLDTRSYKQPERPSNDPNVSFAETALRLGGKSQDEAQRTGKIDAADDQVEAMFARQYQTAASPIHRAVWHKQIPLELFGFQESAMSDRVHTTMNRAMQVVRRRKGDSTLLDERGKISSNTLAELGETGYWGLLIPTEYGGQGASMVDFTRLLMRMATIEPTVAGLASVHGCIGAVDPVRTFGTDDQKQRFLPKLASGDRLSAFALTEPGAGSDLTALATTAELQDGEYVVYGEKLFITNLAPGRTIGLVCMIEGVPSVLVVDLPKAENETFQLKPYGLHALKRTHNQGVVFNGLRVPAENLLRPSQGDGLTIAYHGLNLGRVSLCANAAGTMRMMLANMLPWTSYRQTYGELINRRELVQRRLGLLAGRIVACDALTNWCSNLLDIGYRGEMECIIAKIYGSEAQKASAIDLFMKTHGGRAFLHGHLFGDHVHEFLAPCIYEGEGEMLSMAFFKSLVKTHGKDYFEPIGRLLVEHDIKRPNPLNPKHAWVLKGAMMDYARWWLGTQLTRTSMPRLGQLPSDLRKYAELAASFLADEGMEVSAAMRRHQLKLADRQCSMIDLSTRIQNAVVMLVTSIYAAQQSDPITRQAASVVCGELQQALRAERPSNRDWREQTELGDAIAREGWTELRGVESDEILMRYQRDRK